MPRVLTGDQLIKSVRKRTTVPDDTSSFTDTDILETIDEELNVQVLPTLLKLHAEHLVVTVDVPRNASGTYEIPYRAVGNTVRDVSLINGSNTYELAQVSVGALPDYSNQVNTSQELDLFYVESNKIKLVTPSVDYNSIRIKYHLRPNFLTKVDKAGIIDSIVADTDADTLTLTLSQVGKNFNENCCYDLVGARTPNKIKNFDLTPDSLTISSVGGTGTIVFTLSDVEDYADLIVGDYVTIAEETPVPNIPTEMHPVLAQGAAIQVLDSLGDFEALARAEKRMMEMSAATQGLVDDRVELAPKKIRPRNGTLQSRRGRYRGNR